MTSEKVSGRELELLLSGKKPLAVFYRAVHECYDEKDGQDFGEHVKAGDLSETRFFIQNKDQSFRIMYVAYCKKEEQWRAELYRSIKKIGQKVWNEELERLEGQILGY